MTTATLFILCTGLLAMSASLGVAWWLWTYDPVWPWTAAVPPAGPTASHVAIGSQAGSHPTQVVAVAPTPAPVPVPADDEAEMATTMFFVKGKGQSPDKTQILMERPEFMANGRDEDAPVAYQEQLQTTPNHRAGPPGQPPKRPPY